MMLRPLCYDFGYCQVLSPPPLDSEPAPPLDRLTAHMAVQVKLIYKLYLLYLYIHIYKNMYIYVCIYIINIHYTSPHGRPGTIHLA
jgi:hypothetical protein